VLKFDTLVQYGTPRGGCIVKINFWSYSRLTNFQHLNRYNSAADCSISLRFGTEFDHITPDVLQTFKVKGSKVKITEWGDLSAVKT